ncbi:MAG TPA: hypothetical protein VGK24_19825 [Candidatus Angelobacter sp.]|jgi:hypothetical protein
MFDRKFRLAITLVAVLAGISLGQGATITDQSPRKAIIEMMSGGEASFKKHLTVELQNRLQNLMKGSVDNAPSPIQILIGAQAPGSNKFQAFDIGPILFSFNNPQEHERYEVQLDNEETHGSEAIMGLSIHLVRNGVEQQTPASTRFILNFKKQEAIWRLNEVSVIATLPVGDPRILEKSWWTPALNAAMGGNNDTNSPVSVVVDDRPKMTPLRAVRMIGMAENIYAQNHPGIGYSCSLADLVNVGRGMDEDGMYKFMDAEFASGSYNGYKFTLSGCEHKPARMFRVTAEPLAGRGRAYCSDNTSNLRASDDARGASCLISGKIARK